VPPREAGAKAKGPPPPVPPFNPVSQQSTQPAPDRVPGGRGPPPPIPPFNLPAQPAGGAARTGGRGPPPPVPPFTLPAQPAGQAQGSTPPPVQGPAQTQTAHSPLGPLPNLPLPQVPATSDRQQKRRWSVSVGKMLGLPDLLGQNQILASGIATAARVDETTLRSDQGPHCASALSTQNALMADQSFAAFVTELRKYESLIPPRQESQAKALRAAALAAKAAAGTDATKINACDEALLALRAPELADQIVRLGSPPWQGRDAERATAAKVELDMLSIPAQQRRVQPLQQTGVNPSFWIERKGADPAAAPVKSFLCKPASKPASTATVEGIPDGGEVAREALAGRAAAVLSNVLPLDLDMPETHVVTLPTSYFPAAPASTTSSGVTCSVQEARANGGSALDVTPDVLAKVPASQCASLAILDLVTLNTDRHPGNLLVGSSGGLIPIDHGCTFPMDDEWGRGRIGQTINPAHDVLLRMPGTHQPITEEMAAGLRGLDPSEIRQSLKARQQEVGQDHPDMDGLIDDAALEQSLKATRFLKLAGGIKDGKRRLSPASVQLAFSSNSNELLDLPLAQTDTKAFDRRATEILKQALADQPVSEQICLLDDTGWDKMVAQLYELGWLAQDRNDAPGGSLASDPVLCMKLVAAKIRPPRDADRSSVAGARTAAKGVKTNAKALSAAIVDTEMAAMMDMVPLLPDANRAITLAALRRDNAALRADPALRRKLTREMTVAALGKLTQEWNRLDASYTVFPITVQKVERGIRSRNVLYLGQMMSEVRNEVKRGSYAPKPPAGTAPAPPPQGTQVPQQQGAPAPAQQPGGQDG
jgi:hypothetical protein